jgi:hypothetical protein
MNNEYKPGKGQEELPDWLAKMKHERSGMKVPEGYFDKFPDLLMKKITDQEKAGIHEVKFTHLNIKRVISWTLAAAASFLLIISIWNMNQPMQQDQLAGLENIPVEDAMAYLMDNSDAYSWEDIVEEGLNEEVEEMNRFGLDELSDDAIIDELYEEEILDLL